MDSEGGRDEFDVQFKVQGITDTSESYSEHEASDFEIVGSEDSEGSGSSSPDVDTVRRNEAIRTVITAVENQNMTYGDAAGLVDYSTEWVGKVYRNWRDEDKHTEVVSKNEVSAE
jgi:hypothetical protein